MTILSVLATIFGIINAFANFPQIYKIFSRKSAKDISVMTYSILSIGSIVWLFYGLEIKSFPVIVLNTLCLFAFTIVLIGCYLYGRDL